MTRRDALRNLAVWLAGSPLWRPPLEAQQLPGESDRVPLLDDLVNVLEFEPVAKAKIPKANYDFIAGGVDDEWTLRRNREAFNWISLRPHMLRNVSKLDLSLTLFGQKIETPILVAPTGTQALAHPQAELAMAKAAGAAKTIMVVSTNSSIPIEKIAAAATGPLWFQLYPGPDHPGTRERVQRALAAGCKVIDITLDTPYVSHRERLLRNRQEQEVAPGDALPQLVDRGEQSSVRRRAAAPRPYGLQKRFTAELTWDFVQEVNSYAKVPVLVKGILTPEDAKAAIEHGAAGIHVSNHGGRYLDYDPSTIEVLPSIIDAVGGRVPVIVDSGFRRGTDIIKALAVGAKAVLVGRPPLWGLAAYGQAGAQRVLELLQSELALAMGLSGRPNLESIDRTLIEIHPPQA
jgi:4-hydroxymandelate oxidase